MQSGREKVIDYFASQCDYCGSSIVSGQRWVREKIFDPALNSPDAHYHWYHAEPFEGQEGSCWAKHEWNGKLSEPPPTPLREDIQKVGTRSECNAAGVLRKERKRNKPSVQARCPEYQKLLKQKQVGPIGLAVALRS